MMKAKGNLCFLIHSFTPMKLFTPLYHKTLKWSQHHLAPFWLSVVSFIEAIFFPIPPDIMLVPMSLSQPKKALRFALLAGIFSTLGGIVGYWLGNIATSWVQEIVQQFGYQGAWESVMNGFEKWGIAIVFIAGFSPIPYKVFTLCAGVMQMPFLPFVATAFVSRLARFIIIAKLSAWGGQKFANTLPKFMEIIGWAVVVIVGIGIVIFH